MTAVPADARHELKYVAEETLYPHLIQWLKLHSAGFRELYPQRRINNLYFDTHGLSAYDETLVGASIRRKVRYRWYGDAPLPGAGQLEVKIKRNTVGWKLVFPVNERLAEPGDTWRRVIERLREAVPPEARRWLHESPQPVLINRYDRDYWATEAGAIRATVDTHLAIYDQRYKPTPNVDRHTNIRHTAVVELKCARDLGPRAAQVMASLPLPLSRNSKYALGVRGMQDR